MANRDVELLAVGAGPSNLALAVALEELAPGLARDSLVIDRETASRLGITPQTIDNTLYDAFGQRQVSMLFTQLNQYHAVLEAKPDFQKGALDLQDI